MDDVFTDGFTEIPVEYRPELWEPEDETVARRIDEVLDGLQDDDDFYNGTFTRLADHRIEGETLHLDVEMTDYASHLATRGAPYESDNLANSLSVAGLLHTDDDRLVLGRRAADENTTETGRYGMPAGHVDTAEEAYSLDTDTLDNPVYREVKEELGLEPEDIDATEPQGLLLSTADPMLLYTMETGKSTAEIEEAWQEADDEFDDLAYVDPDTEPDLTMTPNAERALELYRDHR